KAVLDNYRFKQFNNIYIGYIPVNKDQKFIDGLNGSVLYISTPDALKNFKYYEVIKGKSGLADLAVIKKGN
ncbi:MAG: hypothetical protein M1142_03060, partial [Patescibacteria group bacterium]|nr:hypothetical protein [Patescibacteria group bacterium]